MNVAFVFIPLAFKGPCICESGPKVMEYYLKKNKYSGNYYFFELEWNESPKKYLNRVFKELINISKKHSKIIIFGGNHLSLLPVYELTEELSYNSLTLDAHRDYLYNEGMITHGSFLRFIKKEKSLRYISGFRDTIADNDKYNFFDKEITYDDIPLLKNNIQYIDIDIDVLDEKIFPFTPCKKSDGFTLDMLFNVFETINLSEVKILSLSEYAYVLDNDKEGLKIIFSIIDEFIK